MRLWSSARSNQKSSGEAPPSALYIAHSAYHVIMAMDLVQAERPGHSVLVIVSNFSGSQRLARALSSPRHVLFSEILHIGQRPKSQSSSWLGLRKHGLMADIRGLCRRNRFDAVYVGNDRATVSQYAFHLVKRGNARASCAVFEDGAAVYAGLSLPAMSLGALLIRKAGRGHWWQDVRRFAGHPLADRVLVRAPELLPEPPSGKALQAVTLQAGTLPALAGLLESLHPGFIRTTAHEVWDVLFLLPRAKSAQRIPGYQELVTLMQQLSRDGGLRMLVKPHPRDAQEPLPSDWGPAVRVLPADVPVEFIYAAWQGRIAQVLGAYSTGLITARLMLPRATVLCFSREEPQARRLLEAYARLGIEVLTDAEGLGAALRARKLPPAEPAVLVRSAGG